MCTVNNLENKLKHNTYLKDNIIVAQKKFINIPSFFQFFRFIWVLAHALEKLS